MIETGNRSEMLRGGFARGLVLSPAMRISNLVLLTFLLLAGCSTITVGPCGPTAADFAVKDEHKSMVIHPLGCYSSWVQEATPFEAERLALLRCSDTHPDSDGDCKVVATDGSICPRRLESWIKEQSQNEGVSQTTTSGRRCEYLRAFEVKSTAGTKPSPVDERGTVARKDVSEFFTLKAFDLSSSETLVFGRTPDSKGNWIVTEALHFLKKKDGNLTCILRASNGWDPSKHFETMFTVHAVGCFASSSVSDVVSEKAENGGDFWADLGKIFVISDEKPTKDGPTSQ